MNISDRPIEKRREFHSWYYGRGTLEIVVKPESLDEFVVATRRMPGGYVRSVNSRRNWIGGNLFLVAVLVAVSFFTTWLFVYIDALLVGVAFILFIFLCYTPQLRVLVWTLTPPGPKDVDHRDWDGPPLGQGRR